MPKVKELKRQNKDSYQVRFQTGQDNPEELIVSADLVVEYRLVPDKELSEETYGRFLSDHKIDKWFQSALKYCIKYQKSEYEMAEYLRRKTAEEESIPKIIAKLKRLRVLNDEDLAERLAESMFKDRLEGPEKIAFSLRQKGFDESLVTQSLRIVTYDATERNLERLLEKKLPTLKNRSVASALRMATAFLVRKGYELPRVQAFLIHHKSDFDALIDEEKAIVVDYEKALRKLKRVELDPYEKKQKLINQLLAKGYHYSLIKKTIERG